MRKRPVNGRRKQMKLSARYVIIIIILFAMCPVAFFSLFRFGSGGERFEKIEEYERLGCVPNFRPLEFSKYEGSEGFYFDSYFVGDPKMMKLMLVPMELTKRSHFNNKFPFPPPQLLIRLYHHENNTKISSESVPLKSDVVVCQREVCAATKHEYYRAHAYTHIYTCDLPNSYLEDELIEHGLHFSIQRDKRKDNIYYAPDCTSLPKHRFVATTLLKNELKNIGFWIRYLFFLGFEHVYIYDHGSTDGTIEYLQNSFSRDKVTVWDASNRFNVKREDYMRKQAIQLADTVHRLQRNEWVMNIDVDEFPVFLPNLPEFIKKYGEDEDVRSLMLPSVQYSHKNADRYANNYLDMYKDHSLIVSPYDILPMESISQQRTKAIFRPKGLLCAFPHTICSDDPKSKHHYLSVSESYFSHFYRRSHPMPYNERVYYYVAYYEKMEPWHFNKINTKYSELVKAYCPEDTGRCFQNEMQLRDPDLITMKSQKIKTHGYQIKDTENKDLLHRLRNYRCPKDLLYKS